MLTVRRPLSIALALAVLLRPAGAPNLVQNGGFETPAIVGNATLSGCPAGFVWCIGQGNVDLIQAFWEPGEGRQSIELNGTEAGSIYQDLVTTPGQRYTLSFLLSGNPDGPAIETMRIFWGGMDLGTYGWVPGPPQTTTNMLWSPTDIGGLLATSTTTRLEFRSTTTADCNGAGPACGPALDAVSLVAAAVVPEPATLALVGGGVLALGALTTARRRRAD